MTDFRLHTFLEVHRQKSFTRAAEALHLTQPAVTQHIKYLEAELGRPLFAIRGRTITLTAEGEVLLQYARTVEADAIRTRERIAAIGGRRSLRFGATRTIGEFVMPTCIASWIQKFPEMDISMKVDNSDSLFSSLQTGELDFLFVEGAFNRDSYASDILFTDAMIPVCSPRHQLANGRVDLIRLLDETLIVREKGSGGRGLVETALSVENRSIDSFRRILEIGNIGAIKELVAAEAGFAFLYARSVSKELEKGSLVRIDVEGFTLSHDYAFVCLKGSLYEADYRLFLDWCRIESRG